MIGSLQLLIPQVWFRPRAAFRALKSLPAPQAGLIATIERGLLIACFTYLPVWLMGRQPSIPSAISFIPTEGYYGFLAWFTPILFLLEWLLFSSIFHLTLRLAGRASNFDAILNTSAVIDLAVQPLLIIIDWLIFLFFPGLPMLVGVAHWILVMVWITWLFALGFFEVLGMPYRVGAAFCIASSVLHFPIALLFMRPI
jgi:hypothetical protein